MINKYGLPVYGNGSISAVSALQGYQEFGLTGKAGTTETGLAGTTQYYVKVNINGAGVVEFDITTAADTTFAGVIALLNAEIAGVTFAIVGGDLRCTSNKLGTGSSIAITDGTTGTGLLATLTDYSSMDAAVPGHTTLLAAPGSGIRYHLEKVNISVSAFAATGIISITDGTTNFYAFLAKDGNGQPPVLDLDSYKMDANTGLYLACSTAAVTATATVSARSVS